MTVHQAAHSRGDKVLTKCGRTVGSGEARAFDPTCPDCSVRSNTPSTADVKAFFR